MKLVRRFTPPLRVALVALALVGSGSVAFATQEEEAASRVAITRVNLVPMNNPGVVMEQTVLVEDGRITAIGRPDEIQVPEDALVVDGQGKYLLPGLQDLHVHLGDEGDLLVYLAHGVTTVRNLMGLPWHLELRERVRTGELLGPRIFTSGTFVNEPQVRTPDQAREAARLQKEEGYDCVKIHGDLTLEAYKALLEAGHEYDIPIVGHVPRNLRLEEVLALAGQGDISHGEEYLYTYFDRDDLDATVDSMKRIARDTARSGIAVVPNLIAYKLIWLQVQDLRRELAVPEIKYVAPLIRLTWSPQYNKYQASFTPADAPALGRRLGFLMRFTKVLRDEGVPLLLGSDALNPTAIPGVSAHQELALLVQSGLTPYEALRTATAEAGAYLTGSEGAGTITVGADADLLLLSRNPLEDVANAQAIEGVLIGERWLSREELDGLVDDLLALYELEKDFMSSVEFGSLTRADETYRTAKANDPESFVFREAGIESLVVSFGQVGSSEAAMAAAELFLEEFPDSWRAHARFAEAASSVGEKEMAVDALIRAIELRPGDVILQRRLEGMRAADEE